MLNYAWRDYGNRVGAWRLRDLFDRLNLPAAVLVNTWLYDEAPELIAAFRARGDEIVAHGRTNSQRQGAMSEAEEAAMIAEVVARMTKEDGTRAGGMAGTVDLAISRHAGSPRRGRLRLWPRLVDGRTAGVDEYARRQAARRALPAGAQRHSDDRRPAGERRR